MLQQAQHMYFALQVLELQKQHGAAEEEAQRNNKPLAQVLLEAKQAKDEAFQNQWKQMKQGKSCELRQYCSLAVQMLLHKRLAVWP